MSFESDFRRSNWNTTSQAEYLAEQEFEVLDHNDDHQPSMACPECRDIWKEAA